MERSELENKDLGELRRMLRSNGIRGGFAANATKDVCIGILCGEVSAKQARLDWLAKQGADAGVTASEVPVEGVHGETADINSAVDMARRLLLAAGQENSAKELAVMATRLANMEKDYNSMVESFAPEKSTCLEPNENGMVKIGGADVPLWYDNDDVNLPAEVPHIDALYRFEAWRAAKACGAVKFKQTAAELFTMLMADERIMLVGPPASGKTSVIAQFAARCNWPVTRLNFNRDMTVQDFVGCFEVVAGENGGSVTKWVDGPLPRAMREGHLIILDEIDHAPAECTSILHAVLEPQGKLLITANNGEVVSPHERVRFVATANTSGFGDSSGRHPNAQVQDAALLSRFSVVMHCDWMETKHERALLMQKGASKENAALIVKVAKDTRNEVDKGDMLYPVTLRHTLAWAGLMRTLGKENANDKNNMIQCFAIAVLNKACESDMTAIAEIAQRHMGGDAFQFKSS